MLVPVAGLTPIFDQLTKELGDPLDPLPWLLSEAVWEMAKLLTWNPTALRHAGRPIAEDLAAYRHRSDRALRELLLDEGLTVQYQRWPAFPI